MIKNLQKNLTKVIFPKSRGIPESMKLLSYLVILVVIYLVYKLVEKLMCKNKVEGLEGGKKTLVLFHMNGCGHCVKMMPEWDAFEKENDSGILTKKLERSEAGDLLKKHNVKGFPTILLLDTNGNKVSDYNGERSKAGLIHFCNENN